MSAVTAAASRAFYRSALRASRRLDGCARGVSLRCERVSSRAADAVTRQPLEDDV